MLSSSPIWGKESEPHDYRRDERLSPNISAHRARQHNAAEHPNRQRQPVESDDIVRPPSTPAISSGPKARFVAVFVVISSMSVSTVMRVNCVSEEKTGVR